MVSGRTVCSRSMMASAISVLMKTSTTESSMPNPKCHADAAHRAPVASSMAGYRADMCIPQQAARPRSQSQLRTGTRWRLEMGVLQWGQWDLGVTIPGGADEYSASAAESYPRSAQARTRCIDNSLAGTRLMTTLRKLPITAPRQNMNARPAPENSIGSAWSKECMYDQSGRGKMQPAAHRAI